MAWPGGLPLDVHFLEVSRASACGVTKLTSSSSSLSIFCFFWGVVLPFKAFNFCVYSAHVMTPGRAAATRCFYTPLQLDPLLLRRTKSLRVPFQGLRWRPVRCGLGQVFKRLSRHSVICYSGVGMFVWRFGSSLSRIAWSCRVQWFCFQIQLILFWYTLILYIVSKYTKTKIIYSYY